MEVLKKILVIEDSNIVRFEVKRMLEAPNVKIFELNNVEDFFKSSWRYNDINLIILDISLPGMDGLTALEKIHSDPVWCYIPVVMLTASSDKQSVRRAIIAGAVDYIRKPFSREELLERVEQILGPLEVSGEGPIVDVKAQIRKEVNRAKRGNSCVSFMEIQLPEQERSISCLDELTVIRAGIQNALREIDSVLLTGERNFMLILPLTNNQGAHVVIEKIKKRFTESEELKISVVTFPYDGADEETLFRGLKTRLSV